MDLKVDLRGEDSTWGSKDTIEGRNDTAIEVIQESYSDYIMRMRSDGNKNAIIRKQRELIELLTVELKRCKTNAKSFICKINSQFLTILSILTQYKQDTELDIFKAIQKVTHYVQLAKEKIEKLEKYLQYNVYNKVKVIEKPVFIYRKTEKPIYVDRIVEKVVPHYVVKYILVYVDRPVETVVEKIVYKTFEKPVFFYRPVHKYQPKVYYVYKIVYVDRPVEIYKIVEIPVDRVVYKVVYVDKPVFVTSPKRANEFADPMFNSKK